MGGWIRWLGWGQGLRVVGAGLLWIGWWTALRLDAVVHAHPPQGATLGEIVLAAISFTAASTGIVLLVVGPHLHDRIRVAARWAAPHLTDRDD